MKINQLLFGSHVDNRYLRGKVVVDHQRYLLDVDTTSPHIGGDEDTSFKGVSQKIRGQAVEYAYDVPPRNSAMIASLSFWTISPCMDETVKLAARIFSVNQST